MPERSSEEFVRAAQIRLALAAGMYESFKGVHFGARYVEMSNVAMLIWSAGIDLISAHMLLNGETGLGTSSSRRRYLMRRILPANRSTELRIGWSVLSRLHNFQHNLDLSGIGFAVNCRDSAQFFADLNGLLPATLRLPPAAYVWLADVG